MIDKLGCVRLDKDEILGSLVVESHHINLPFRKAMDVTAELFYTSGVEMPLVDRTMFTELLEFEGTYALLLTESG